MHSLSFQVSKPVETTSHVVALAIGPCRQALHEGEGSHLLHCPTERTLMLIVVRAAMSYDLNFFRRKCAFFRRSSDLENVPSRRLLLVPLDRELYIPTGSVANLLRTMVSG